MGGIVSHLLRGNDAEIIKKLKSENDALSKQLAERSSEVASLEERRKNLETLLAQANELTERQRRAAGQLLARSVGDACRLIHDQLVALYKQQQQGMPTSKLNVYLNNILAECRYLLQVEQLFDSYDENPGLQLYDGDAHAIVNAICINVTNTYNALKRSLEAVVSATDSTYVGEVAKRIDATIASIRDAVRTKGGAGKYEPMLNDALVAIAAETKRLAAADTSGSAVAIVPASEGGVDLAALRNDIADYVQIIAERMKPGCRTDVKVELNAAEKKWVVHISFFSASSQQRNAGADDEWHSVQVSCMRCGLAMRSSASVP